MQTSDRKPPPAGPTLAADSASGEESSAAVSGTRRVLRNTVLIAAGDAVTKVGVFALYAVIARSLGESGFGDYTLAVSLAFFIRVSALGTDVILTREVARDPSRMHGLFWNTIVLKLAAGTPVLAGILVFTAASGYPVELVVAVALIGASNLIDVLSFSLHAVLRGREEMGPPAKALALENLALVTAGSIALLALGGGLVALGGAYLIAALVGLVYIRTATRKRGIKPRRRGDTRGLGWLAGAAVPTGIASFFSYALARIDAVILSVMTHDPVVVGRYGAAYRIFDATLFVSWGFGLALFPRLSRLGSESQSLRRLFAVSCMATTAVTAPLGGAMALFGPTIVQAAFGSDFAEAGTATRILGGAAAVYGTFTVAALTIAGQDRQRMLPWISGTALALNVALNLVLIPPLGLNGAAIAMTVTQVLATAFALGLALRQIGGASPIRMFAAPLAGLAAMAGCAVLLGLGAAGLAPSLVAYAFAFFGVEWLLHRDDLALFWRALRRRGANEGGEAGKPEPTI